MVSLQYGVTARATKLTAILKKLPDIPRSNHVMRCSKTILKDRSRISMIQHGFESLKMLNPSWSFEITDDGECETYLKRNLAPSDYALISKNHIVEKCDLWR